MQKKNVKRDGKLIKLLNIIRAGSPPEQFLRSAHPVAGGKVHDAL